MGQDNGEVPTYDQQFSRIDWILNLVVVDYHVVNCHACTHVFVHSICSGNDVINLR